MTDTQMTDTQDFFYEIIREKVIDHAEIVLILFEECNMKCVFCPQDHASKVGQSREEILSKADPVVKYIHGNMRTTDFHFHIMGGELFQDHLIEAGFLDVYAEFMETVREQCPGKNLTFRFVTNLITDRIADVAAFADKHDLKMNVSYDPVGRFNGQQLETFKRNIEAFEAYVNLISLVITKQNIERLLKGDEYHDYLYAKFPMSWDSLLPGQNFLKVMMPSASELFAFYELLLDKYPLTLNLDSFTGENTQNKMACTRGNSFTVLHDGTIPVGCSGSVLMKEGKTQNLESTIIIQNFMKERNCFSCEYYKRCGFSCFIRNDYKDLKRDLDECAFKKVFRIVDAKRVEKD